MTQFNNKGADEQRPDSEQLDLIEVLENIWHGRKTIFASIVIVLVIAVAYIFIAKEKWTSTAIVTLPDSAQISTYSSALKILHPTDIINLSDVRTSIGERYVATLSALSRTLDNQEEPEELAVTPVDKGNSFPVQVTYVGTSAESAQQKLTQYLQMIEQQVVERLLRNIKKDSQQQALVLQSSLKTQTIVAEEQRDLRVEQLKQALKYAEEANITKPQVQQAQYVTQETMFLLGSEGLRAMVQNESSRPLVYSDNYYLIKNSLLDIQNINIDPNTLYAYSFVMKPDLPIKRDSPKIAILVLLAIILGGVIGTGIVLTRNFLNDYRSRH